MAGLTIEGAERLSEVNMRELCPEAFALTCNEALRLRRINYTLFMFFDTHREFIEVSREAEGDRPAAYHNIYNDESIALLRSTFKSKRISLSNAAKLAERVLNGKWFALDSVVYRDNDDGLPRLYLSTGGERKGVISREDSPEVYSIWDSYTQSGSFDDERMCNPLNAEALREALSLEAGYQYITSYEIDLLRTIKHIAEYTSQPFTVPMQAGYVYYKSTPQTRALNWIGNAALKAAEYDNDSDTYIISAGTISIKKEGKPLSFDDSIACKQLEQILLNKAYVDNFTNPNIELTLDEFMRDRQLTDRAEARDKFIDTATMYYQISYEFVIKDKDGNVEARYFLRPLEQQAQIIKGRGKPVKVQFGFGLRFFSAMRNNKSIALQPKGALALTGNAYRIGADIWDDIRANLGKGKREGKLKILTLLKSTSLSWDKADTMAPSQQRQRIIDRFFKALSKAALSEYWDFSYKVYMPDGKTEANIYDLLYDYNLFISCYIVVKLNHEPEHYTQLRQRKYNDAEAADLAKAAKVERDRATVERANKRKASSGKGKGKDKGREPVEPVKRGT